MPRDRNDSLAIRHHDMLALPRCPKSCFLQRLYHREVIYAGDLWHLGGDLDFANVRTFQPLIQNIKVFLDRALYVIQCLLFSAALRPTTG